MNDKLQKALTAYLVSQGKQVDPEREITAEIYVQSGSCSCESGSATLDLDYRDPGYSWVQTHEISDYDVTDFLAFIAEFESE